MIEVIDRLLEGDQDIARRFARAKLFWTGFHLAHRHDDEETLAGMLGGAQMMYEDEVWDLDRHLAKTTMPWTAVATLYDGTHGFGDNREYAARLLRAFKHPACSCSSEVKFSLDEVAATYTPEG